MDIIFNTESKFTQHYEIVIGSVHAANTKQISIEVINGFIIAVQR